MGISEIISIIVGVLLLGACLTLIVKNAKANRKFAKEMDSFREELKNILESSATRISEDSATQTTFIDLKSNEEKQAIEASLNQIQQTIAILENKITAIVDVKMQAIENVAKAIHEDVHTNLSMLVFDNVPNRSDKVKSQMMDKLGYAIKHATEDNDYLTSLMSVLSESEALDKAELARLDEEKKQKFMAEAAEAYAKIATPPVEKVEPAPAPIVSEPKPTTVSMVEFDEQLERLSELMKSMPQE